MKNPYGGGGFPTIKPQQNFDLRQMEHAGTNPIHEAHLQKALQMKAAKLNPLQAPKADMSGSPWLAMNGGKK